MTYKVVLIITMLIGAMLVYLAGPIAKLIKLSKDADKNILIMKVTGFIIVIASAIIVFVRF